MNIKKIITIALSGVMLVSCGGDSPSAEVGKHVDNVKKEVTKAKDNVTAAVTDPMKNKGVGPISSVTLGEIDQALVDQGKELFKKNCKTCHKIKKRYIGPALKGVTERRTPEWIMNMIMDPNGMVANDPIAKKLLAEYNAPMSDQSITKDQARAILEYFRTNK